MKRGFGFTLIELVIVMSAGSVLMLLAIGLVADAMRLSSQSRERVEHQRTVCRLAEQFRRDVHRASDVTIDSPSQALLDTDEGQITYSVSASTVTRLQLRQDGVSHHDSFVLAPAERVQFESSRDPRRAALILRRDTGLKPESSYVDRYVAAVIGRLRVPRAAEEPSS